MLRARDLVLLAVIFTSMGAGILLPEVGRPFAPYPRYFMMALLFLSFLPLSLGRLFQTVRVMWRDIAVLTALRLLFLPLAVFLAFKALWPPFALSALLLSGVSAGVVSPFFSLMVGANSPLVLAVVVATSLLVPFTLPFLVEVLAGGAMDLSLWSMTKLLSMVIFIPIVLVEAARRASPALVAALERLRFAATGLLFALTNLGVFSAYSEFFRTDPATVLRSLAAALVLAAVYLAVGIILSRGRPLDVQLSVIIVFGIMNNILVLVFSAEFFGPLESAVAALYSVPFFAFLLPLKLIREWGLQVAGRVTDPPTLQTRRVHPI